MFASNLFCALTGLCFAFSSVAFADHHVLGLGQAGKSHRSADLQPVIAAAQKDAEQDAMLRCASPVTQQGEWQTNAALCSPEASCTILAASEFMCQHTSGFVVATGTAQGFDEDPTEDAKQDAIQDAMRQCDWRSRRVSEWRISFWRSNVEEHTAKAVALFQCHIPPF